MNSRYHVTLEDTQEGTIEITSEHKNDSCENIATVVLKDNDNFDDVVMVIANLIGSVTTTYDARRWINVIKDNGYKIL